MTNHVPTLETCQKMKEAGFPQGRGDVGAYWWMNVRNGSVYLSTYAEDLNYDANMLCAAPILTEILEQLPDWCDGCFYTNKDGNRVYFTGVESEARNITHTNPAEAAALLWLELNGANE